MSDDRLRLTDADVEAYLSRLRAGWLTMGPQVQEVEAEMAARHDVAHALAVATGTFALQLGLRGLGIGPGDEVLVPAWGSLAAAGAVREVGARPVLVDGAGSEQPAPDVVGLAAARTERTRALVVVHPPGRALEVGPVRELCVAHGIALVEDAADAVGARDAAGRLAGTLGDLGALSFSAARPLTCGEGGMVLTDRADVADVVRSLRSHAMTSVTWDRHRGHAETYDVLSVGVNARLDEPRAALLRSRLARLDDELGRRRALAAVLREGLAELPGVRPWPADPGDGHGPAAVGALVADDARDAGLAGLARAGHHVVPRPALTGLGAYAGATAPNAERFAARLVELPVGPGVEPGRVLEAVRHAAPDPG